MSAAEAVALIRLLMVTHILQLTLELGQGLNTSEHLLFCGSTKARVQTCSARGGKPGVSKNIPGILLLGVEAGGLLGFLAL